MELSPAPFTIDAMGTSFHCDPQEWRARFAARPAMLFGNVFAPALLARLMHRADEASFVPEHVERVGSREVETPQRVGASLSLMLGREPLYQWFEQATAAVPIRGVSGRVVRNHANGRDELVWHDDILDGNRRLAAVVSLTDQPYSGGLFEMRRSGEAEPFLAHHHVEPGSMMVFAVRPDLQHRVTPLTRGGPRRVWAGWFLSQPEDNGLPGT